LPHARRERAQYASVRRVPFSSHTQVNVRATPTTRLLNRDCLCHVYSHQAE
jgi:hypothetical protein